MFKELLQVENFKSFIVDGVICKPFEINGGYYLPLGWEDILNDRNINYNIVTIEIKQEEIK